MCFSSCVCVWVGVFMCVYARLVCAYASISHKLATSVATPGGGGWIRLWMEWLGGDGAGGKEAGGGPGAASHAGMQWIQLVRTRQPAMTREKGPTREPVRAQADVCTNHSRKRGKGGGKAPCACSRPSDRYLKMGGVSLHEVVREVLLQVPHELPEPPASVAERFV